MSPALSRIALSDVKDLVAYEKVREEMRARVIALKNTRRIALGENLTLLFENRDTVLYQVQEMVRTERIVDEGKIQDEIDAYEVLLPGKGELAATLFIEILDIARMTTAQMREAVNRFQGLDLGALWLHLGEVEVPARFESGHSKEERLAAVHYLRFAVPSEGRAALAAPAPRVRLTVEHPRYRAEAAIPPALCAEMVRDLTG